jgi:hypothetical protein
VVAALIRDILHRRTDLSTFVVHLTRRLGGVSALDAHASIARTGTLEARMALGWAKEQDDPGDLTKQSQRVVCFTETPLEHINLIVGPIQGRAIELEPYGVALTKLTARKLGANPVWYVDMTEGRDWVIANTLDQLRDWAVRDALDNGRNFHDYPLARLFPFIEQMGTWTGRNPKEFWWEREWRHVGSLQLPASGLIWLCPEDEIEALRAAAGRPEPLDRSSMGAGGDHRAPSGHSA